MSLRTYYLKSIRMSVIKKTKDNVLARCGEMDILVHFFFMASQIQYTCPTLLQMLRLPIWPGDSPCPPLFLLNFHKKLMCSKIHFKYIS